MLSVYLFGHRMESNENHGGVVVEQQSADKQQCNIRSIATYFGNLRMEYWPLLMFGDFRAVGICKIPTRGAPDGLDNAEKTQGTTSVIAQLQHLSGPGSEDCYSMSTGILGDHAIANLDHEIKILYGRQGDGSHWIESYHLVYSAGKQSILEWSKLRKKIRAGTLTGDKVCSQVYVDLGNDSAVFRGEELKLTMVKDPPSSTP